MPTDDRARARSTARAGRPDGVVARPEPAPARTDVLRLVGVSVHYEGAPAPAVRDVELSLAEGETLALLGPSGCGKSSLLRAVAGLEYYTGEIFWADREMRSVPVHRRGFGLMFQDGQLFPHRTVGGNVAYGLQMAGMSRANRVARVAELLELVGLAGYAGRRIATLSGGEQQRVALARALAPKPQLLLLDEPLSALDRSLRENLAIDLRRILQTTRTTALYVTHDQDEAFAVADRVALMRRGEIYQLGAAAEVWSAPRDADAAQFLGYRLVDDGALALGPRALHVVGWGGAQRGTLPVPSTGDDGDARAGSTQTFAGPSQGMGHLGSRTLTGRVHSLRVVRGEMIADVEIPAWGLQPAITTMPLRVGEQVSLRLQADQVAHFDAPIPASVPIPASAPTPASVLVPATESLPSR